FDQIRGRWVDYPRAAQEERLKKFASTRFFIVTDADDPEAGLEDTTQRARKFFGRQYEKELKWQSEALVGLTRQDSLGHVLAPDASEPGTLTEPREFNLMFKTIVGALGGADDAAFLRPETAQGIFANFKNVVDTVRVRVPFGIVQIGKSFRN